jgi:hypothetical protein
LSMEHAEGGREGGEELAGDGVGEGKRKTIPPRAAALSGDQL